MGLVDYSDSEEGEEDFQLHASADSAPPSKKAKLSPGTKATTALPPLPAAFRDLYSSTVRTSVHDDPALHAGRKRVIPHVVGNWPTHVYLEWCPEQDAYDVLCLAVRDVQHALPSGVTNVQSLLQNELGVQLPLHVSLSRPLALKTEQKDQYLTQLKEAIAVIGVEAFEVTPSNLVWHANEDRTRWFLVLRLQPPARDELKTLLQSCNELAAQFGQPLLYEEVRSSTSQKEAEATSTPVNAFHISIAWSLHLPSEDSAVDRMTLQQTISRGILDKIGRLRIPFSDVKSRIGQEVTTIPLPRPRTGLGKKDIRADLTTTKNPDDEAVLA